LIRHVATAGAALPVIMPRLTRAASPNEQLNVAFVATGGKGGRHVKAVQDFGHTCTAYCDVDTKRQSNAAKAFPEAKGYRDYREMFEKEHKNIDAVFIAPPDHSHFPAAMTALQHDMHVYCQKPLTWGVWEARRLAEEAKRHTVATQMGNQGHAGEGWRILVEWIRSGAIGDVREVHTWTNRPVWPQGLDRPSGKDPVPDHLNWDAWIGPAPMRPFKKGTYHPFKWRGWLDFGAGALGDMACHTMDGLFWAMDPAAPLSVEPVTSTPVNGETFPNASVIKWRFPAKGDKPAFDAYWYDGGLKPARPPELEASRDLPKTGNIFYGTKGTILVAGDYGESPRIIPEAKLQEIGRPPKLLDRAPDAREYTGKDNLGSFEDNHHLEFFLACTGEKPVEFTKSHFGYAGPMTEAIQLGNVALKVGRRIGWDGSSMKITNVPEANKYIKRKARKGWSVV
jgi:predicted dehydrogenase